MKRKSKACHVHAWVPVLCGLGFIGYSCGCGRAMSVHDDGTLYYSPHTGLWLKRRKK